MVNVHLNLSHHDKDTFTRIAAAHGMSPVEMIERFIGDVVKGSQKSLEIWPVLADGYVKELNRYNLDESVKFSVFMQEYHYFVFPNPTPDKYDLHDFKNDHLARWIDDGSSSGSTRDYWAEYLAYCSFMNAKPETMERATSNMRLAKELYYGNVDKWQSEPDEQTHDADPDGSNQKEEEMNQAGNKWEWPSCWGPGESED